MDCAAPASFTHTRDIRGRVAGAESSKPQRTLPEPERPFVHPPSRQAGQLAEGQRNAGVQLVLTALPPPPANGNWRKGPNSSRNMHILTIGRRQLAEGASRVQMGDLDQVTDQPPAPLRIPHYHAVGTGPPVGARKRTCPRRSLSALAGRGGLAVQGGSLACAKHKIIV